MHRGDAGVQQAVKGIAGRVLEIAVRAGQGFQAVAHGGLHVVHGPVHAKVRLGQQAVALVPVAHQRQRVLRALVLELGVDEAPGGVLYFGGDQVVDVHLLAHAFTLLNVLLP